jgi:Alpha/beta hydrolase domain
MAVTALEINTRQPLAGGRNFGSVGHYIQLDGTTHFAVDPAHPVNSRITDIQLAPRDGDGRVHFSADIRILTPEDPRRGNHRLLFDVPNRGNRLALATFNRVPRPIDPSAPTDAGDGFLMRHGYTVVWCGWQHDVPAVDGLMRIKVPEAREGGGPVSGRLLVSFQPNTPSQVQLLSDRGHRPYSSSNLNDPDAALLVRDGEDEPSRVIPRQEWSFARLDAGRVVPDADHIYLAAGFAPGKIYHVIYTTACAPVIGLGLLAARDTVAFIRHGSAKDGNPCAGDIRQAYAFGASQSGRYLRQFLYIGLNEDEQERMVFDGVLVHIAGGKRGGDFNQRFGQPSASLHPTMSNAFPFNDNTSSDPVAGRNDGLLARLTARRRVPKIFFTNSSTEYWRGDASLIHTDAEGENDVPLSADVRLYHFAGTQHSAGALPLTDTNPVDGARGQQALNSVDYNPFLRAALMRMDEWVNGEKDPPQSRYPRLADCTAVAPNQLKGVFTAIPRVGFPAHLPQVVRLDFGPDSARGVATILPPLEGKPYPNFVPAVDRDGNEVTGIRLPDLAVPLATYTGWNLRHPQMGAADRLMSLMGSTIPFPATPEDRERTSDPRRSIAERYPRGATYLEQVRQAAQRLIDEGYLLAEDLELVVGQASRRYELLAATREPVAAGE